MDNKNINQLETPFRDNLICIMTGELKEFISDSYKKSTKEFIEGFGAYELIYKEDILSCFEYGDISISEAEALWLLSETSSPLDYLYRRWLRADITHMEMLREFLLDEIQRLKSVDID